MEPELSSSIRGAPKPSSSRRKERELTLRCGKGRVSSFLVFPLVNECVFTKTSGKPDGLPLLFESSGHRRSPTQAKNKAGIAGRQNYFFDTRVARIQPQLLDRELQFVRFLTVNQHTQLHLAAPRQAARQRHIELIQSDERSLRS